MATLFTNGKFQAINATGIVPGAKLFTYQAGTLVPLATYTNQGGLTTNTNPVVCDASGQANVWLGSSAYRMILKDASDVTIWDTDNISPKIDPANVSILRAATGSVATNLQAWTSAAVLDAGRDFGVLTDGSDQTAKMILAIAAATAAAPCTLMLPKGVVYCATSLGNLAVNGLTIRGAGLLESTLQFGHSGVAMLLDAFASGSPSDPFVRTNLLDFTIQGNTNTTHLLQAQGIARSNFRLNAKDANAATGIAYHLKGVMLSELELYCSEDMNTMSFTPSEGLRMDAGTRATVSVGNSSNNIIPSCRMVGLLIGVRLSGADQNVFMGGASESNTTYGVLVATGSRYNTFINHGMENPGSASACLADAGESSKFINCYADKTALLQGIGAEIAGGFWQRIEVQSGATKNRVKDVRLNNWLVAGGGFFDSGTATEFKNLRGTSFTASFATNVMTVSAIAQGQLAVGQVVVAAGVATGTTITSFGTGTGGTGTYNLSTSPGTIAGAPASTLAYVYPYASRTNITVGASPFTWENTTGQYVEVIMQTGTVTQVRILRTTDNWLNPTAIPGKHLLAPSDQIEVSYSSVPGMSYLPHNGFQG